MAKATLDLDITEAMQKVDALHAEVEKVAQAMAQLKQSSEGAYEAFNRFITACEEIDVVENTNQTGG